MEGEDNSVTMVDVLKEQEAFEEDAEAVLGASDDKNCTYPLGYIKRQALYACLTCCPESVDDPSLRSGVCLACSLACHEKHTFVELYTKRNFRCDCGGPKFKSKPCSFTGQKSEPNSLNQYNQNFSGLYCVCHRPYPDPDATEPEDEMIQCIVCEDWLHSQHLDSKLPPPDQYAEMICQSCMANNEFLNDYLCFAVSVENKTDNDVSMELNVTTDDVSENANEKSIEQSEKVTETVNPSENSQSVVGDVLVSNNEISLSKDQVESGAELVSSPGDNIELNAIAPIESELDRKDGNISEMQINSSESEINTESTELKLSESASNDVLTIKPIEEEESMEIDQPSATEAITAENTVGTQNPDENNTEKILTDKSVTGENLELNLQSSDDNIMEVNEKSEFDVETPVAIDSSLVPNPAGEISDEDLVEMVKNIGENTTPKLVNNITETENVPEKVIDNISIEESGDNITESKSSAEKDIDNTTETKLSAEQDIDNITEPKLSEKDTDNITEPILSAEQDIHNISESKLPAEKDPDNITEPKLSAEPDVDNIAEPKLSAEKDIGNITEPKLSTEQDIDNITEPKLSSDKDIDNIANEKSTDNVTETEMVTEKDVDDITVEKNSDVIKDSVLATEKDNDVDNVTAKKYSDSITEAEEESSAVKASDIIPDTIIPPEKDIDNVTEAEIEAKNNTDIVAETAVENGNDFSSKSEVETNDKITEESKVNIAVEPEIKAHSNPDSIDLQENLMSVDAVIDSKSHFQSDSVVDNESKDNPNNDKNLGVTNSVACVDSNHLATQVPNSDDAKLCEEAESNVVRPEEAQSVQMTEVSANNSGKDDLIEQSKTSETSEVAISDQNEAASKESASVMTGVISNSISEMVELMDTCEKPSDVNNTSEIAFDKTEEPLVSNQTLEVKGDINISDPAKSTSEGSQLEPDIEKSKPESQLSATNHGSDIIPDSNEKPVDSAPIIENTKISEPVTDNSNIKDAEPITNENETTSEIKDKKRKLEHDDVTVKGIAKKIKSEVMDCIRPAACLRLNRKGAAFWPSDWRSMLCSCPSCLDMYSERKVSFLIDVEDTITAYERLGKIKTETSSSQYEKGMDALSSLGHVQQINAITEYNRMKEKLLEFLKTFKDKKEVVKEEDIKGFFAGMKPKREPDGVYFCQ